jgi:hypothetical protein
VHDGREHKTDPHLPDALTYLFGTQREINAKGFKNIGTSAMTRHGTVPMFRHRQARTRDDKSGGC